MAGFADVRFHLPEFARRLHDSGWHKLEKEEEQASFFEALRGISGHSRPDCLGEPAKNIGHSSFEERILLIKGPLGRFDLAYAVLIEDREFIGTAWLKYLPDNDTVRRRD